MASGRGPKSVSSFISPEIWRYIEIFIAETVGTGLLLFLGCLSLIVWKDDAQHHPFQAPLVFASAVSTIVQLFGHISAAHLNPAVTLCFVLLGLTTVKESVVYIVAECLGAFLGYVMLMLVTPKDIMDISKKVGGENFCLTVPHPSVSDMQAVTMEFIGTGCLIFLVCTIIDPRNANHGAANTLKFFIFVLLFALTIGPYTGCSINPARSLAPALYNGYWDKLWIYFLAPMVGALVVTIFYQTIFAKPAEKPAEIGDTEENLPLRNLKGKTGNTDELKEDQHV